MTDLLLSKKRVRTVRLWALPGGNNRPPTKSDGSDKPHLTVVK